jgi:hypothetical protein
VKGVAVLGAQNLRDLVERSGSFSEKFEFWGHDSILLQKETPHPGMWRRADASPLALPKGCALHSNFCILKQGIRSLRLEE